MRPVRVAVIGAGWYAAASHIPALAAIEGVELDGVCRLGDTELERVRSHFGFAFASQDYRAVLARAPDAVVVASPHHLHHEHAVAALAVGAHVLVEKPMTLDPAQAWDLVRRAEAAGRSLLVANGYHYLPGVVELRALLSAGAVGRIEHVACSFVSATRAVFAGETGLARWNHTFFRPDRMTWQDPVRGGGFAFGQMSHAVALSLWLTGLRPARIAGATFAPGSVDLCNAAALICDGGAVVSLSGAAAAPEGDRALLRLIAAGSDGVFDLAFDLDRAVLRRHDGAHRDIAVRSGDWNYDCVGPVRALIALAHGGEAARHDLSPARVGALTVATIAAMLASAANGSGPMKVAGAPQHGDMWD